MASQVQSTDYPMLSTAVGTKAKSKAQISADIQAANHALLGTNIPTRRSTKAEVASTIAAANQKRLLSLYRAPSEDIATLLSTGSNLCGVKAVGTGVTHLNQSKASNDLSQSKRPTTLEQLFGGLPPKSDSKSNSSVVTEGEKPTARTLDQIFGNLSLSQVLSQPFPVSAANAKHNHGPSKLKSIVYDAARFYDSNLLNVSQDVLLSMLGAVVQNLFHGASHKAAGTSLLVSNQSRKALLRNIDAHTLQDDKGIVADVRTAMKAFLLEPEVTIYACCPLPACCATYPPKLDYRSGILNYPMTCTNTRFNKICGSSLVGKSKVINGRSVPQPIKSYAYNHFHDHVAGMLSRPGIEEAIRLHVAASGFKDEISDIMSSKVLQGFVDCDGKPFLKMEGTEIRLVWALCVDWYNPNQNKAAGKSVSTGVVAMICLSLPPHLRTLEENIYLAGVIPGPREPSLDAVNHFLLPLIKDLKISYDPGVYLTRTHDYLTGRNVKSALIPVICDTMASKKVTGNCGHGAQYFCSRCRLTRKEIDNLDISSWPPGLPREEHEAFAHAWKEATSATAQNAQVKAHGIRWSALLDLPYWQPSQWTITEGMHILLLGVVPRHCRDLLGLNVKDLPSCELDGDIPSEEAMDHGRRILDKGSFGRLRTLKMNVLKALCKENDVVLGRKNKGRRTKAEYIAGLTGSSLSPASVPAEDIEFASLFSDPAESANTDLRVEADAPVNIKTTVHCSEVPETWPIITKDDLLTIQQQIIETIRPYWQAQLPQNFGTPEHGKLKADQWRTAIEFDIPVSLVQLLATSKFETGGPEHIRLRKIVEHTLDLAMAISWGLSRRTSKHHAERYAFYMHRYLCGIQELFPDYDLKPNHHYALHLHDILLLFGPLHGTWAFPLERLIGRLQSLNTNGKIGEMEVTVLKTFCRRANLRRFISSKHCPTVLQEAWADLEKHIDTKSLDDCLLKDDPGKTRRQTKAYMLDPDILQALKEFLLKNGDSWDDVALLNGENALGLHRHCIKGIQYADFHTSLPHSLIYFSDTIRLTSPPQEEMVKPAQIRQIFEHRRIHGSRIQTEFFFAIHRFKESRLLPEEDYFASFTDFRAAIYENDPQTGVEIIRPTQVKCHANRRPWNSSSFVMRAVNREY